MVLYSFKVFWLLSSTTLEKAMATHPSTLAWKIPRMEEPGGLYSPWGRKELDTTERLHFHFSLSHIVKGNGNPLQCSCLENPRDGGAWWAAIYGVAQSWTWLKWLISSWHYLLHVLKMKPNVPWSVIRCKENFHSDSTTRKKITNSFKSFSTSQIIYRTLIS